MNLALIFLALSLPASSRTPVNARLAETKEIIGFNIETLETSGNAEVAPEPPQRISNAPVINSASAPFVGHNNFVAQGGNQFRAQGPNGFKAQ